MFPECEKQSEESRTEAFITSIKEVLDPKYRKYLNIFKLEYDTNLTDTIIKAVDKGNVSLSDIIISMGFDYFSIHRTRRAKETFKINC